MEKVLIPFDGSNYALHAVGYVIGLLQQIPGLKIGLVHTLDPTQLGSEAGLSHEQISHRHSDNAADIMRTAVVLLDQAGVSCEQMYRIGDPANEIASLVREKNYDAIIMGTRGMGAVANLMIGSVAMKTVHLVQVPVMLIK
jgi:nucleotide-binding universal stress UspA family protein